MECSTLLYSTAVLVVSSLQWLVSGDWFLKLLSHPCFDATIADHHIRWNMSLVGNIITIAVTHTTFDTFYSPVHERHSVYVLHRRMGKLWRPARSTASTTNASKVRSISTIFLSFPPSVDTDWFTNAIWWLRIQRCDETHFENISCSLFLGLGLRPTSQNCDAPHTTFTWTAAAQAAPITKWKHCPRNHGHWCCW